MIDIGRWGENATTECRSGAGVLHGEFAVDRAQVVHRRAVCAVKRRGKGDGWRGMVSPSLGMRAVLHAYASTKQHKNATEPIEATDQLRS